MASLGHNELTYWPSLFVVEHHREEERTSCPCVHTSFSFFFSLTLQFLSFPGWCFPGWCCKHILCQQGFSACTENYIFSLCSITGWLPWTAFRHSRGDRRYGHAHMSRSTRGARTTDQVEKRWPTNSPSCTYNCERARKLDYWRCAKGWFWNVYVHCV